jgi:hypothetical protein
MGIFQYSNALSVITNMDEVHDEIRGTYNDGNTYDNQSVKNSVSPPALCTTLEVRLWQGAIFCIVKCTLLRRNKLNMYINI